MPGACSQGELHHYRKKKKDLSPVEKNKTKTSPNRNGGLISLICKKSNIVKETEIKVNIFVVGPLCEELTEHVILET